MVPNRSDVISAGGDLEAMLVGHEDKVYSVSWSSDAKYIASASGDKSVRVNGCV